MKRVIVILGMQGSGISVAAQLCQCMGAYFGEQEELTITRNNLENCFENRGIAFINEKLFHICGRDWYSLEKPELKGGHPQLERTIEELKAEIERLFEKSDLIAISDSRIAALLPIWEKILGELGAEISYIWAFRNPAEVAEFLKKKDGFSRRHSLLLWIRYNLNILEFLREKQYLLFNDCDIKNNSQLLENFANLIGRALNDVLRWELDYIIKKEYVFSYNPDSIGQDHQSKLAFGFYRDLLKGKCLKINVSNLESQYVTGLPEIENRYADYRVLDDIKYLREKEIIIYGAGNYGKQAAEMLQDLGIKYNFCDKNIDKHGSEFMGGLVLSMSEIEEKENLCIVIAIGDDKLKKEIEQTLLCLKGADILSFFALKKVWKYSIDDTTFESKAGAFSLYYYRLLMRSDHIKRACEYPVLVYQSGKVGSMTVSNSLSAVGVKNAHIHGFFFKNDITGELIIGKEYKNFMNSCNILSGELSEYSDYVKEKIKGKKIISMVREPIAVDLSTVFQWTYAGSTDRYFAQRLRRGVPFIESVSELMVRIQGRLFRWFDEELKELTGIDVFATPFDREQGYRIISENGIEILLMKAEKLSQMTEVIRDFTGNHKVELVNHNVGKDKEYAHIYEEVKKNLKLPNKYVEYYYSNNPYMDYFYSEEEKKIFLKKWTKCMRETT